MRVVVKIDNLLCTRQERIEIRTIVSGLDPIQRKIAVSPNYKVLSIDNVVLTF